MLSIGKENIQKFKNFVIWKGMNYTKLIFVLPYFQFYLRAEAVMAALRMNGFSKSVAT